MLPDEAVLESVIDKFPLAIQRLVRFVNDEDHPILQLQGCCDVVETALKIGVAIHGPLPSARLTLALRLVNTPGLGTWWQAAQAVVTPVPDELRYWLEPVGHRPDAAEKLKGLLALRNHIAHFPRLSRKTAVELAQHHLEQLSKVLGQLHWLLTPVGTLDGPPGSPVAHVVAQVTPGPRDLFPVLSAGTLRDALELCPQVYVRAAIRRGAVIAAPIGGFIPAVEIPNALADLCKLVGAAGSLSLPEPVIQLARRVFGRSAEIERLKAWLAGPLDGSLPAWIQGGPGIGKSALLSAVALDVSESDDVRWCGFARTDVRSPFDMLKGVLDVQEGWTSWEVRRHLKETGKERPIITFVDGLDEIIGDIQRGQVLDFVTETCADRLPIRWVMASRAPVTPRCPAEEVFPGGLGPLTEDAIHTLFMELNPQARNAVLLSEANSEDGGRGAWIHHVRQASEGLPQYLSLLFDELNAGTAAPGAVVPKTLPEYFGRLLSQQGFDDVTQKTPLVLASLALSPVELDEELLATALTKRGTGLAKIGEGVERLVRSGLIIRSSSGLRLYHDELRKHVVNSDELHECRALSTKALIDTFSKRLLTSAPPLRGRLAAASLRILADLAPRSVGRLVTNGRFLVECLNYSPSNLEEIEAHLTRLRDRKSRKRELARTILDLLDAGRGAIAEAAIVGDAGDAVAALAIVQQPTSPVRAVEWPEPPPGRFLWPRRRSQLNGPTGRALMPVVDLATRGLATSWAGTYGAFLVADENGGVAMIEATGGMRWRWNNSSRGSVVGVASDGAGAGSAIWDGGWVGCCDANGVETWVRPLPLPADWSVAATACNPEYLIAVLVGADMLEFHRCDARGNVVLWTHPAPAEGRPIAAEICGPAHAVVCHADGTVRLWDEDGARVLANRDAQVMPECVTCDAVAGRVAIGWADGQIWIVPADPSGAAESTTIFDDALPAVTGIRLDGARGRVVSCHQDRVIVRDDVGSDVRFLRSTGLGIAVDAKDGTLLVVRGMRHEHDIAVELWTPFSGHERVVALAWVDGGAVSLGSEGTMASWDVDGCHVLQRTALPGRGVGLDVHARLLWTSYGPHHDEDEEVGAHANSCWLIRPDFTLQAAPDGPAHEEPTLEAVSRDHRVIVKAFDAQSGGSTIVRVDNDESHECRYYHPARLTAVALRDDGMVMVGDAEGRVLFLREDLPESSREESKWARD